MRQPLIAGVLALGVVASSQIDLSACGDKFLLVGRGARYQAYAALYPASILLYSRTATSGKTTISDSRFATALKQAGHRVRLVTSPAAMTEALSTGRFDIVLALFADAVTLDAQVNAVPAAPKLLPLLYQPSSSELANATRQFDTVLKGPDKVSRFLAQIDEVMKARLAIAKVSKS